MAFVNPHFGHINENEAGRYFFLLRRLLGTQGGGCK
jgi:hypothetical protein